MAHVYSCGNPRLTNTAPVTHNSRWEAGLLRLSRKIRQARREYCACHAECTRRSGNAVNSERGGPSPSMLSGELRFCTMLLYFLREAAKKTWRPSCKSQARASRPQTKTKRKKGFASKAAGNPGKPRPNPGEKNGIIYGSRKNEPAREASAFLKRCCSRMRTARRRESRPRATRSNRRASMERGGCAAGGENTAKL